MSLANLFGRGKTPAEQLKANQRSLQKAMRDLDRERNKMEQQEKKLILDIKKSAKAGQMNATKVMAKDLVRTRRYVQKFYEMKTQLQGVSLQIQTMRSTQTMGEAMRNVTKAMSQMNKRINLPGIQKIMTDFQKESQVMDMKEEIMNDVMDDAMAGEDDEAESDEIVQQVLDEIGVNLDQSLVNTPGGALGNGTGNMKAANKNKPQAMMESEGPPQSKGTGKGGDGDDNTGPTDGPPAEDDLQARLDALRRG